MANSLFDRLRGARRFGAFAAAALLALLALVWLKGGDGGGAKAQKTALEMRLEVILSKIDGAGEVSAMVNQADDGTITGAVIVAEGLADVKSYLTLQSAVRAALDVDVSKIRIIGNGAFGGEP